MKKSGTVIHGRQSESPAPRHLPLVDILIDTQAELQELVVTSGLKVLEAMLEEDRVAVCGPRYAHQPARRAYRAGHAPSEVVLGGRKVAVRRPRVRRDGHEVPLPSVQAFTHTDPLNRRIVEQMLVGVATRQYGRSLEPLGPAVRTRGTSKSAVSRRFVTQTPAQLDTWRATPLDDLDLVALLIDGVHVGGHCIVVALGLDNTGLKHPLGLWEGSTENATVVQGLLTNVQSRGLRTDRSLLVILDGAQALHTAVTQTFGPAALVQRCQVHKRRNVLEHLPEAQRPWVKAILTRAYTHADVKAARRLLQDLARRLDAEYPSAAASGCLCRSLLIGHLPLHEIVGESTGFAAPLHWGDECDRRGGVRQAWVRQLWKAGPQHRGPRLVCDEVGPPAAVPLHSMRGNAQHEHGDRVPRSSLQSTGVRPGREPTS